MVRPQPTVRLATLASLLAAVTILTGVSGPAVALGESPDACPNGYTTDQRVAFASTLKQGPSPSSREISSGVLNPSREDGCTLLDLVWNAEPYASSGDFLRGVASATQAFRKAGLLTTHDAARIVWAAGRVVVSGGWAPAADNSCTSRIALTFDDGPSFYRPETLRILRDKQVPVTFFDSGIRVDANPQITRYEAREGHLLLNHTYSHAILTQISSESRRSQILEAERAYERAGVQMAFKGLRPPNTQINDEVLADAAAVGYEGPPLGDTDDLLAGRLVGFFEWLPETTAEGIRAQFVEDLRPATVYVLHDGPMDSPHGANVVEALPGMIDDARARGFCFGILDPNNAVVAARYVPTDASVPSVTNPVPYIPLSFSPDVAPPEPFVILDDPPFFD